MPVSADVSPDRGLRLGTLLVGAVALLAYAGAVPSGFAFDDRYVVLTNPVVQGTAPLHTFLLRDWWGSLAAHTIGSYRPFPVLSLRADWRLGQWFQAVCAPWLAGHSKWIQAHGAVLQAWPMHLSNVCLHAVAMVLMYRVFRRIVPDTIALAAALLCAVMAAPSEVVQALPGRADLLETIGLVGGLWAHRRSGRRWGLVSAGCLLLALGSKESGVMALLAWPALDFFVPPPDSPWRRRLGRFGAYAGCLVAYLACRRIAIGTLALPHTQYGFYNPLLAASTSERVFGAGRIFLQRYVFGIVDPRRRLYDCSAQACTTADASDVVAWAGLLLFFLCLASPLVLRRRSPVAAAGLAWFAIFFAPVSNVFVPATLIYGERLLYVPMIGLALAAAAAARAVGTTGWLALSAVGLLNGALLQARHDDWRSDATLAASGLRYAADSVIVQENNATAALDRANPVAAEAFARHAVALVPSEPYAHQTLAVALFRQNRRDEAETEFRKALALQRSSDLVMDFANFLAAGERYREALDLVEKELGRRPQGDERLQMMRDHLLRAASR